MQTKQNIFLRNYYYNIQEPQKNLQKLPNIYLSIKLDQDSKIDSNLALIYKNLALDMNFDPSDVKKYIIIPNTYYGKKILYLYAEKLIIRLQLNNVTTSLPFIYLPIRLVMIPIRDLV